MSLRSPDFWKNLKYFKPTENWGDPNAMCEDFILKLEALREAVAIPMHINCAYETIGHSPKSWHGRLPCKAVDCNFGKNADFLKIFELAVSMGFKGVGFYFDWNTKGFHLDMRSTSRVFWWRENGKYTYFLPSDVKNNTQIYKKFKMKISKVTLK